jgi:phosphoenolpyruvate carboxykinase (GTP)
LILALKEEKMKEVKDVNVLLKKKLNAQSYEKLMALNNPKLHSFVADAIELTGAKSVFVCSDSDSDFQYIKDKALKSGEEKPLDVAGHTYHFDGYFDQGRDKEVTRYLLKEGSQLADLVNHIEYKTGTEEIKGLLKDSMVDREMIVAFFCLGPVNSEFSIPCVQITDSPYVAHSESILYRRGYQQFKKIGNSNEFFRFFHSEGELENLVSKNVDKKRIYIDLQQELVYSVNTQYAGNTVGLKKLALRLAINKSSREGWLAEHMFVMGVHGPKNRVTYFTGAFPSACGKTSTSMINGQTIVGDDIGYFRKINGQLRCVNVEKGIFGIIQDVCAKNDPLIYKALTNPGEVIFSNVLINNGRPYWLGMGVDIPNEGVNHAGKWKKGDKDKAGAEITASHKNARYCMNIADLDNRDVMADAPEGVTVGGFIYGGRDSDTWVPVEQAFNWTEGIIAKGASIESETTAATLGKEGVRTFNPMSNMDFLSITLGKYIQNNLDIVKGLKKEPSIFAVNYFLKDKNGKYLNGINDKKVWILWAELRANGDVEAIKAPTGMIPKYEDLARLFKENLAKDYSKDDYIQQFSIRIPESLAKLDRIEKIYKDIANLPETVFQTFGSIRKRLESARSQYGDCISPFNLKN